MPTSSRRTGFRRAAGLTPALANIVLSNPPFGSAERMRPSPDGNRASAHVMPAGGLKKWIAAAADLIAPRGVYVMIHRADALGEALAALEGWLGSIFLKPVHPRADAPASRILIRAVKGGRAPLVLLPLLVLHDANGRFTAEAESSIAAKAISRSSLGAPMCASRRGPAHYARRSR